MLVSEATHVLVDASILGLTDMLWLWQLTEKPAKAKWKHGRSE